MVEQEITPIQMEKVNKSLERYIEGFKISEMLVTSSSLHHPRETFNRNMRPENHPEGEIAKTGTHDHDNYKENYQMMNGQINGVRYSRSTGNLHQQLDSNRSKMQ